MTQEDPQALPVARIAVTSPDYADLDELLGAIDMLVKPRLEALDGVASAEIEGDARVTLYYPSPDAVGYVTVTGRARLVDDPGEKAARWKPEWEAFYQDRAADYILIQVTPERLEVVDYSRGIVGDPRTWQPPFVEFPGGPSGP